MAFDLHHLCDKHIGEGWRDMLDVLDFEPRHRQATAQFIEVRLDRDEFLEPAQRQFHEAASLADRNWPRKRKSFSKNRRRSSTPSLSSEVRSTPIPKAKPENSAGS